MKKFLRKIWLQQGSALLVALLVMGVLMSISLALSSLILRETRITSDFLESGRAYYAAESAIETALYQLENNLPGWEPAPQDDGFKSLEIDENLKAVAEYKVKNRCKAYPCFDEGYDLASATPRQFYDVLDLNESITIPLFIVDEEGQEVPVGDFTVEFFSPFDPAMHLEIDAKDLNSWDVLRWKVFGINKDQKITETISDFTALTSVHGANGEVMSTAATLPAWFGSTKCDQEKYRGSRYNEEIKCSGYAIDTHDQKIFGDQVSEIAAGTCENTQAREYYLYTGSGENRKVEAEGIQPCYPIKFFLDKHSLNYLSLTNLVNTSLFKPEFSNIDEKKALAKLYFRVELFPDEGNPLSGNQTSREFADITANGYSGDSKQSINVKIQKGSFMPVFNFSLYSTYKDESVEVGHDYEYWYGVREEEEQILP